MTEISNTKKLWGGRFTEATAPLVEQFTSSIVADERLIPYDILGSLAHADMLGKQGIIPQDDADTIIRGLSDIFARYTAGTFALDHAYEDVHMNIEAELSRCIGEDIAGKLHTGRSRNDQVALDLRMWMRDTLYDMQNLLHALIEALVSLAEENTDTVMPGFTHLQYAMPVTAGHHLLAYAEMFYRDSQRFTDQLSRVNVMPLGSAALAGSGFPLDRKYVADILHFPCVSRNSMDTVGDRDHCIEFASAAAMMGMHMSRLAEDMILWMSQPFSFIDIDDAFCTGSSLMPNKKNPDILELIRGKTARLYGDLTSLLTVMKGTPMTYNRDFQEDKPPLFDAADTTRACLSLLTAMLPTVTFKKDVLKAAVQDDFLYATDWAEYLVRAGVAFRQAHEYVGRAVQLAVQRGCGLSELPLEDLKEISPHFSEEVHALCTPEKSVAGKKTEGSTSPVFVEQQCAAWRETLSNYTKEESILNVSKYNL